VKKHIISVILVSMLIMTIGSPVLAAGVPRASTYFSSYTTTISANSSHLVTAEGIVYGVSTMTTIGAQSVAIQKYQSGAWTTVKTVTNQYATNTNGAGVTVTYQGTAGVQYRAQFVFYAANSSGSATTTIITTSVTA